MEQVQGTADFELDHHHQGHPDPAEDQVVGLSPEEYVGRLIRRLWDASSEEAAVSNSSFKKDLRITCGDPDVGCSFVDCHRAIVGCRSPLLRHLLSEVASPANGVDDGDLAHVHLEGFSFRSVQAFVRCCYMEPLEDVMADEDGEGSDPIVQEIVGLFDLFEDFFFESPSNECGGVPAVAEGRPDFDVHLHPDPDFLERKLSRLWHLNNLSVVQGGEADDEAWNPSSVGGPSSPEQVLLPSDDDDDDDGEPTPEPSRRVVSTTDLMKVLSRRPGARSAVSGGNLEAVLSSLATAADSGVKSGKVSKTKGDGDARKTIEDSKPVRVRCSSCFRVVRTTWLEYREATAPLAGEARQGPVVTRPADFRCRGCWLRVRQRKAVRNEVDPGKGLQRELRKRAAEERSRRSLQTIRRRVAEALPEGQTKKVCPVCSEVFSVFQGHLYWEHVNRHRNKFAYRCAEPNCDFGCQSRTLLAAHRKQHRKVNGEPVVEKIQCDRCPLICSSKRRLAAHIKLQHDSKMRFECDLCYYRSTSQQGLNRHKTQHHTTAENRSECRHCGALLGNRKSLAAHLKKAHAVEKRCKFCDFSHLEYEVVRLHVREKHADLVPFACHLCNYSVDKKKIFNRHLKTIHKDHVQGKVDQVGAQIESRSLHLSTSLENLASVIDVVSPDQTSSSPLVLVMRRPP